MAVSCFDPLVGTEMSTIWKDVNHHPIISSDDHLNGNPTVSSLADLFREFSMNLSCNGEVEKIAPPQNSSTSPTNKLFSSWSPILVEKQQTSSWSNVNNWMNNDQVG